MTVPVLRRSVASGRHEPRNRAVAGPHRRRSRLNARRRPREPPHHPQHRPRVRRSASSVRSCTSNRRTAMATTAAVRRPRRSRRPRCVDHHSTTIAADDHDRADDRSHRRRSSRPTATADRAADHAPTDHAAAARATVRAGRGDVGGQHRRTGRAHGVPAVARRMDRHPRGQRRGARPVHDRLLRRRVPERGGTDGRRHVAAADLGRPTRRQPRRSPVSATPRSSSTSAAELSHRGQTPM